MTTGLIILGVIVVVAVVAGVVLYNGLVRLRNLVQEAWAQIDVELKRRHDLIGNLVETVKGYAAHEKGTLEEITRARAGAMAPDQSPAEAARSEAALSQALVRLNAVAESYPDLKANQNFLALQNELSATEDRIASARRYYNANVRELNTKVQTVPTNVIAGFGGIKEAEYFEVEGGDREAPRVSFGTDSAAGTAPPGGSTPSASGAVPSSAPPLGAAGPQQGAAPPPSTSTPQDAPAPYGNPTPPAAGAPAPYGNSTPPGAG